MNTKYSFFQRSFVFLLAVSLTPQCARQEPRPGQNSPFVSFSRRSVVKPLTSPQRSVVFEDAGTIAVYQGQTCTENTQGDPALLDESLDLPSYATNATVFLNGWHARYLDDDHNVKEVGAAIQRIRLEGATLKWQATGDIADGDFDKPYRWCYYYTAAAWNPANVSIVVDQADAFDPADPDVPIFSAVYNDDDHFTTALTSFSSFLVNPDLASGKAIAILPRGFLAKWVDFCCFPFPSSDHNLAQIAFNLDHSEIFVEPKPRQYVTRKGLEVAPLPNSASQVDSGFVSWDTTAVFKDDGDRMNHGIGEMVSALGGADVGVIQPPFTILPEPTGGAFTGSTMETKDIVVDNVPFEYAIPMLTGWSLRYPEGDKNVGDIGTWIEEIHYRDPNDPPGRLRYKLSSVLTDNESSTVAFFRHRVTILGIKPVARGGTPNQSVADLVPFSPAGTDPASFCRLEEGATKLRLSVKNQGNGDAVASKATVVFGKVPVTVDAPPIPAGGSIDLRFNIPLGCFSPDCSFNIRVDSGNQIPEGNELNNATNGGCVG